MPSQNVTTGSEQGNYYQLRADGESLFRNDQDYRLFLSLMEQYVLVNNSVEALAYCLAPDHFSLLLFQSNDGGIERLMHSIVTGYNRYYFGKYAVDDLLSESSYKVSKISANQLLDVSRSVHKESCDWADCEFSSIRAYFYDDVPVWLNKKRIAEQYGSAVKYQKFLTA